MNYLHNYYGGYKSSDKANYFRINGNVLKINLYLASAKLQKK